MLGLLIRDKKGNILTPKSDFQPDEETKQRILQVQNDFSKGQALMNKPFREFNDRSVVEYKNDNARAFNNYIPPRSDDPDESWRAQTIRPITRNKIISIVAHITATILYPNVFAQNPDDVEDKAAAEIMRDLIKHTIDNSEYAQKFVDSMVAATMSPAAIVKTEFAHVVREVKQKLDNGEITTRQVVDELFSGFQMALFPIDELYIANIFESNIQKQGFLIENRNIPFSTARSMFHDKANFREYVTPGRKIFYVAEEDTFFESTDDDNQADQVNVVVYHNRSEDLMLTYVNNIPMDESPDNPNPRDDKMYPFGKTGYEPINEGRFFYYKSAVEKMAPDQDMVDVLYNMILDGTFLNMMPPMALFGSEDIDSGVMVPGAVVTLRQDSKMAPITQGSDLRSGMNTLNTVERSLVESSNDPFQSGILPQGGERTALEISKADSNAQKILGLFGKQVRFFVEDIGDLMIGDILQHLTVADISNLTSVTDKLRFKSFILPNEIVEGKNVTKQIKFDPDRFDGKTDPLEMSFDVLEEEGGMDSDTRLIVANPDMIRQMKYRIVVSADDLFPKSQAVEKALNLEAYDRLIQNPLANQEAVYRDFLIENYKPGESDKYIKKPQPQQQTNPDEGRAEGVKQSGVDTNMLSQITGSKNLSALEGGGGAME